MTRRFAPLSNQVEGKITFETWPGLRRSHIRRVLRWRALLCRSVLKSHLSEMFRCKTSPRRSFNDEAVSRLSLISLHGDFRFFSSFFLSSSHQLAEHAKQRKLIIISSMCARWQTYKHRDSFMRTRERRAEMRNTEKNCFLLDSAMDSHARFNDCKMIFFRATEKQNENMIFFRSVLVVVVVAGINTETSTENHRDKFNRLPATLEKK